MSDKMLRRLGAWLRLAVGCALALSVAAPAASQQDAALLSVLRNLPDRIPFPVDVVQSKSAVAARSQRIDPLLLTLSDDVSSKGASSLTASAGALQMSVRENRVAVKLIAEDRNGREELEWRVEDEGGVVTATLDNGGHRAPPPTMGPVTRSPQWSANRALAAAARGSTNWR